MNTAASTHYDALGAPRDATHAELRRAYVELARRYHPDFHVGAAASAQKVAGERMRRINEAWAVLGDPERRRSYDRGLGESATGVAATTAAPRAARRTHPHEPSSGHRPPRWMQLAPAALLAVAIGLLAVGFVTGLVGLLAAGLGCAVVGGASFVLFPMLTAMRSRHDRPAARRARPAA